MSICEFRLILERDFSVTEETAHALYEAGCDDGTPFSSQGIAGVGFSREARSLEEAVRSAIADVSKTGFSIARVEPADESIYHKINQELASH
jgi:hypothetical protein